jgi:cobalt/nickel transport system permease protein
MAHIPDGVASASVLIAGAAATIGLLTLAIRRLDYERIPQAAVLSATFFIASLVSVPVGPSSVHLILNGLMGVILGWAAVPALTVALTLQALFFGYGGLAVLGLNTLNLALPALLCGLAFSRPLRDASGRRAFWLGAAAGTLGVCLSGVMVSGSLALSSSDYLPAAGVILATYLPLLIAEAAITGAIASFLIRVSPEILMPREPGYD